MMPRTGRPWTSEEIAVLQQNASLMPVQAISEELERTEASVERKLRLMGIPRQARGPVRRRPYREPTEVELHHMNRLHLGDLKRAGHSWWQKPPANEPDVLPSRFSTDAIASFTGSPAAMCAED